MRTHDTLTFLLPLLVSFCCGCASQTSRHFDGTLVHQQHAFPTPVQVSRSNEREDSRCRLVAFALENVGTLVFVADRAKNRLSPCATYFLSTSDAVNWDDFLAASADERRERFGASELFGRVHVARWQDRHFFRIEMDVSTSDGSGVTFDGVLRSFDRYHWSWTGLGPM
jgi:hypothetical protein